MSTTWCTNTCIQKVFITNQSHVRHCVPFFITVIVFHLGTHVNMKPIPRSNTRHSSL